MVGENDFKTDAACIEALAESMMALPSLLQLARQMLQGITRPQSPEAATFSQQIDNLRDWIFEGKPAVSLYVPQALIPLLIAMSVKTHVPSCSVCKGV